MQRERKKKVFPHHLCIRNSTGTYVTTWSPSKRCEHANKIFPIIFVLEIQLHGPLVKGVNMHRERKKSPPLIFVLEIQLVNM